MAKIWSHGNYHIFGLKTNDFRTYIGKCVWSGSKIQSFDDAINTSLQHAREHITISSQARLTEDSLDMVLIYQAYINFIASFM